MKEVYAGLDVSDKETHICLVDGGGKVLWRGRAASDPQALSATLNKQVPALHGAVLETGPLSTFLYHGLRERGVPVTCVCARHAKKVLSARLNKTDPNDAEGLAQLARTGWYKAIHVKDNDSHLERAHLKVREQLVKCHRDLANQLRGLLKLFGLKLGAVTTPAKRHERLQQLLARQPRLRPVLSPLLATLSALEDELVQVNKALKARVAADPVCRRLMTTPGVGPVTAMVFKSSIEDPGRFARSGDVGAYAGLTPKRYQSGERDVVGQISRAGDKMLRHALYEAANSLLARLKKSCALKTWGKKLAEHKGAKRARVAVARKLAILLLTLWRNEQDFDWHRNAVL